ncbi:MAG TPA: GntR family transcriptional regulator [Ruminiclostridium sp.]|nr:GntR family transcriptional regulator [Ruminiclostridium sp.]
MIDYAEAWKINRNLKTSFTEQLVRNIRWSIFTGEVRWTEKLPPIRTLADALGVSMNTVRNAYKRLEQQEMVVTKPHVGTIVLTESMDKRQIEEELVTSIKNALYCRLSVEEVRDIVERVLREASEVKKKNLIFVYEEKNIGHRFAMQIAQAVNAQVEEVALDRLEDYLNEHRDQIEHLDAIITTYFLYAQVRSIARSYQSIIYGMTVELSSRVIDVLTSLKAGSTIAVICRKEESADGFVNLVHRMYPDLNVEVYHETEQSKWKKIARNVSALFASPVLTEKIRQSGDCPMLIYEMWDRINEQSMNMLKDYLH